MSEIKIYKILFHNQGKVYEMYAKNVHHSAMFGFIEIEKLLFGEKTSVVVDPTEENLKNEFNGVERTYIPMHSIIRIDEVKKYVRGSGLGTVIAMMLPYTISFLIAWLLLLLFWIEMSWPLVPGGALAYQL